MSAWIAEYWPWSFIAAWLLGAWGLALVLSGGRRRRGPLFSLPMPKRKSFYGLIDYRIPAFSHNTLQKLANNTPDSQSIYLRAEFFLASLSGFKPDTVLSDWFHSAKWAQARKRHQDLLTGEEEAAFSALKRRDLSAHYRPRKMPKQIPLALSFPLLPNQFTIFVGHRFPFVRGGQSGIVEPGPYRCEVSDWRDEDSYATAIELKDLDGTAIVLDQKSLLDALRLQKAAVEQVRFLSLPIARFMGSMTTAPKLRKEQRLSGRLAIRPATAHEFGALDARFIKLFGGLNPLNLVRLSWFYHPESGINPNVAKYKRILARADSPSQRRQV